MECDVKMNWKIKNTNLHIYMDGAFDTEIAFRLAALISRVYQGTGNVFMHTRNITTVTAQAKELFGVLVKTLALPCKSLYFTGQRGFLICHNGGRVIISRCERQNMGERENMLNLPGLSQ